MPEAFDHVTSIACLCSMSSVACHIQQTLWCLFFHATNARRHCRDGIADISGRTNPHGSETQKAGKSRTDGSNPKGKAGQTEVTLKHPAQGSRMLRSCAKAERFRDSAERPVDSPDLRAMRGDARGNELSIDEADAFRKQAASFEHVSHVRRAYGW